MGLESANTIGSLVPTNPLTSDPKSQGDDHLRLIKEVLIADAASKAAANTFSAEMILLSTLRVDGHTTLSSMVVTGIGTFSTLVVVGNMTVSGTTSFSSIVVTTPITFSSAIAMLSTLRVDGITSLSTVAATRASIGATYLTGTLTASTQAVTKQYVDAEISDAARLKVYSATSTADVTINTTETQTGITFSAVAIPTDGLITLMVTTARLLAGASGPSGLYAGIRVNGVNYMHQYNSTGTQTPILVHNAIGNGQYHEWLSLSTFAGATWEPMTFDVAANGIATGTQNIEVIMKSGGNAQTLKGATTTTRARLTVADHTA